MTELIVDISVLMIFPILRQQLFLKTLAALAVRWVSAGGYDSGVGECWRL